MKSLDLYPPLKGLPDEAEQILRNFRQPDGGLELAQAFQELVKIFGPGSEAMSTKLLEDLAVDSSGRSRASWDIAMGEAIDWLKEDRPGEKGKQNGVYLHLFVLNLRS
jgi:hypothetical protein